MIQRETEAELPVDFAEQVERADPSEIPVGVAGEHGEVYRGAHDMLGYDIAIVVLPTPEDEEELLLVEQAAQTIARIRDAHIASTLDFIVTEACLPILVTDLVEGATLRSVLDRHGGSLPWTMALEVAVRVLQGLAVLHANGALHRNITPSTIVLVPFEEQLIKLIDLTIDR